MKQATDTSGKRVKALLLAGGVGARLRPLTDTTPKCLVPISGRPLLDYWFDALGEAGVDDVLVNTHHLAGQVRAYLDEVNRAGPFRVIETFEPQLLGSGGTVHANREWVADAQDCLLIYADNLSGVNLPALLRFHASHDDPMTMMLFHASEARRCGIATLDGDNRIVSFVEKPERPKSDLANAGVYVVSAQAYREIADLDVFDLGFDVLPRFVGRMRGWLGNCYHRDIGTVDSLRLAEEEAPSVFDSVERINP
ncbi:MAG: nucleotidyltransferase family protein [bacterium]|nr:nucleotidyltransferase family protein [bacterium]